MNNNIHNINSLLSTVIQALDLIEEKVPAESESLEHLVTLTKDRVEKLNGEWAQLKASLRE